MLIKYFLEANVIKVVINRMMISSIGKNYLKKYFLRDRSQPLPQILLLSFYFTALLANEIIVEIEPRPIRMLKLS